MPKEEAAFKPIPIVSYLSEETEAETYAHIKDEIAGLFKSELADLDKEDDASALEAGLAVDNSTQMKNNSTKNNVGK